MYSRDCWTPILEYIEDQFDIFLEAETRVTRVQVNGEVKELAAYINKVKAIQINSYCEY